MACSMTVDHGASVKRCAAGDMAALRGLYEAEASRMIAVARRIVRRTDIAEEVVQEAFLQIWRHAGRFDPALGSARAWIYAIVRNRALNVVRDAKREDLVDEAVLEEVGQIRAPVEADIMSRLAVGSRLRRCLDTLDATRRESLLLAYVWGYSHGEIAGRLNVPLGTAKGWVRRGLAALKDCMS